MTKQWTYEVHELSDGISCIVYDQHGQAIADHLSEEYAKLIAAAPCLLEALQDLLASIGDAKRGWADRGIRARAAARAALSGRGVMADTLKQRLAEYFAWTMNSGSWQGCDIDGGCAQDKAIELGLLDQTTYDPAIHGETDCGCEAGDDYYVLTADVNAALLGRKP